MAVLQARDITKTFREGAETVPVLRGVSLEHDPGEIVLLEGPSESGKTTLLSIAGCILTPTGGKLTVNGEFVDKRPERPPDVNRNF
jgi:putative ABC transport system ATP-binding protein